MGGLDRAERRLRRLLFGGVVCCLLFVAELCRVMGAFDLMRYGFGSLLGIFHRGDAERERKYADFASYLASGKRGARSRKDDAIPPGASGGIFLNVECAFGAN